MDWAPSSVSLITPARNPPISNIHHDRQIMSMLGRASLTKGPHSCRQSRDQPVGQRCVVTELHESRMKCEENVLNVKLLVKVREELTSPCGFVQTPPADVKVKEQSQQILWDRIGCSRSTSEVSRRTSRFYSDRRKNKKLKWLICWEMATFCWQLLIAVTVKYVSTYFVSLLKWWLSNIIVVKKILLPLYSSSTTPEHIQHNLNNNTMNKNNNN